MIRPRVVEKETKIKEGMKMMSLDNGALVLSWVFHFGITYWVIAIGVTALSSQLFVYSDSTIIFMYFFFFVNATLSFCYWLSTLFSRSKTASIVGVMCECACPPPHPLPSLPPPLTPSSVFFGGYIINTGIENSGQWMYFAIASLHPVAAFTIGLNGFVEYEDTQVGVTFFTWDATSSAHAFTFKDCVTMLGFDIFFWGFMTW
jgi:ATP-binding cassette subfamily A (ABC1) protein 3